MPCRLTKTPLIFDGLDYTERYTGAFEAALANKLVVLTTSVNNTDKVAKIWPTKPTRI